MARKGSMPTRARRVFSVYSPRGRGQFSGRKKLVKEKQRFEIEIAIRRVTTVVGVSERGREQI